jgi:hypothetical protein
MDHRELYADGDGIYFSVFSPYGQAGNESHLRDSYGYYAYPDLYGSAYTYVKAMPVLKGGCVPPEVVDKLATAMATSKYFDGDAYQ